MTSTNGTAFGHGAALGPGDGPLAFGALAYAEGDGALAVGFRARAVGRGAVAIGDGVEAIGDGVVRVAPGLLFDTGQVTQLRNMFLLAVGRLCAKCYQ